MRQNENAREPLDALQAERPLTIKFLAAPLPACHQRPMTILGLFQISSRAFDSSLSVFRATSAARSLRTSFRNPLRACSFNQARGSGACATAGRLAGVAAGVMLPRML